MDMNLNDVFNIDEPVEKIRGDLITKSGEVIVQPNVAQEEKIEHDYDQTRNNLHTLLQQGQEALIHALDVAKASEHPRAFEVVGGLMKQLADVNHQLLDLSEKRQKLLNQTQKPQESGNPQITNNNAIFVGSTAELSKMIHNMSKGE